MHTKIWEPLLQTSEFNEKKHTHRYREQTSGSQWEGGGGNIGVEEWEVQTIGSKMGSRVLHNTGNIANIL